MNKQIIKNVLDRSIGNLFKNQPNIFRFTTATGQTEWNLVHHIANEISDFFPFLDCDLDVTKRNIGNKRPDIIFHKRGTHRSNFLVVEVKSDGDLKDTQNDKDRISQYWFRAYKYTFGAVINLRSTGKSEIKVFENSSMQDSFKRKKLRNKLKKVV